MQDEPLICSRGKGTADERCCGLACEHSVGNSAVDVLKE
jgi:hypothetical protein